MAQEKSKLTKNRKLEKSFEDLLTGLSDESDDDIDDLVDFDNLPEMCSDATLIAIAKTNKPYTNSALDDSLKMSDFGEQDLKSKSKTKDEKPKTNLLDDSDDFISKQYKKNEENIERNQLIDFDDVPTTNTEVQHNESDDLLKSEHREAAVVGGKLIELDDHETDIKDMKEFDKNENSLESNDDEDDKYEANFDIENDERDDSGSDERGNESDNEDRRNDRVEVMVTDESGNVLDMEQDTEEAVNGRQREESIDLDAIVQDNAQLDVDIGKQKTALRKRGSLAKRRKPSRNSIHSIIGGADEESHFTDSTEPKPSIQNGHADDEDVFYQQSSSNESDVTSPPAKKPHPGMVALPGMPLGMPRKKTGSSTPSDSDITPDDQKKDFRNIGVRLPISTSHGSSESDNPSDIPMLRKMSDREPLKSPVESTHEFEKPKLKAVGRPDRNRKGSGNDDSKTFDIPALKQVEKSPTKTKSSEQNNLEDMDSKHVFQTPKLRRVENAPTESLQFVQGKTGESDDAYVTSSKSRISDDSRHVFQTPKLRKVDNLPTQTLRNLHGNTDGSSNDSEIVLSLGHHNEESSTDDMDIGMYFEKPQLRNVPKPTETLRNIEKSHFQVPDLKNVPKMELESKSPTSSDSDKKFNVPQLKSVQKDKESDNQGTEEGTFQIPTLRSTPLPKSREPPKSPETKTFDVPALRRTPRIQTDSEPVETEKRPTGVFEKPKLKSARSLQQDMDDSSNKETSSKHKFEIPTLRNTPNKIESSVKRSDSSKLESEKPSWLQDTKLRPSRALSVESGSGHEEKPSWLSSSKEKQDAKENKNTNNQDIFETTPRKSSIPLQETRAHHFNAINGHQTSGRTRLTSGGAENDGEDHKGKKGTGRDQYVPSWLKTTDNRGKSPSTPNLAFCTPAKDSSEVPQWRKELAEKRKGRKNSDAGVTPQKTELTGEKGLPPWKVELGQMKMRQTPAKAQETKKTTPAEPEWKKAAEEKRQRLRNSGLLASLKTSK